MRWIRTDKIKYTKPSKNNFLKQYNDLLASILVKNDPMSNFKYIASATLNRLEAQTHFFEKVEKYIQIRSLLATDSSLNIVLVNDDTIYYEKLSEDFRNRVIKEDFKKKLTLKEWLKRSKTNLILFVFRWVRHFSRTFILTIISNIYTRPKKGYDAIIRTHFDFRCKSADGSLREEYFGPFCFDFTEKVNTLVVFKLINDSLLKLKPKEYLALRNNSKFDNCLLESFLTPLSVFKAFFSYFGSKILVKEDVFYKGTNITWLLQKSLDEDYFLFRGLVVYIEYEAAKKMLKMKPRKILLPYENQTWEKIYPYVRKQMQVSSLVIIGFQHTGLSYKLLNYFPSELEKNLPFFPDKILTVGNTITKLLEEDANFPCQIITGAALRHYKCFTKGKLKIKNPVKKINKKIVYAFSYDIPKYKDILNTLIEVFKKSSIEVYLKIHPIYDEHDILKNLSIRLPSNFILAQKIPWESIYQMVDFIIYDDNSIGLEGLISGIKTYMLDVGEPIYDCGRMFNFNEWKTSINTDDLFLLKEELENGSFNKEIDVAKICEYLLSYYQPYSKEDFFEKIG